MKLALTQIGDEGCQIEQELEVDWLLEVLSGKHTTDFRITERHRASVKARRMGLDVYISAECSLRLQTECAACLQTFDLRVPVAFSLTFKPRPQAPETLPDEVELSKEDLEECFYEGDLIDLEEIFREQIILALPMFPRCSQQCRGLCPVCGINLNEETCDCRREEVDPRWAALKTFTKN